MRVAPISCRMLPCNGLHIQRRHRNLECSLHAPSDHLHRLQAIARQLHVAHAVKHLAQDLEETGSKKPTERSHSSIARSSMDRMHDCLLRSQIQPVMPCKERKSSVRACVLTLRFRFMSSTINTLSPDKSNLWPEPLLMPRLS